MTAKDIKDAIDDLKLMREASRLNAVHIMNETLLQCDGFYSDKNEDNKILHIVYRGDDGLDKVLDVIKKKDLVILDEGDDWYDVISKEDLEAINNPKHYNRQAVIESTHAINYMKLKNHK